MKKAVKVAVKNVKPPRRKMPPAKIARGKTPPQKIDPLMVWGAVTAGGLSSVWRLSRTLDRRLPKMRVASFAAAPSAHRETAQSNRRDPVH
jgi:hypothetical protein